MEPRKQGTGGDELAGCSEPRFSHLLARLSWPRQGLASHPIPQELPCLCSCCVVKVVQSISQPGSPAILGQSTWETHLCLLHENQPLNNLSSSLLSSGLRRLSHPHWHNYIYNPAIMTCLEITPSSLLIFRAPLL